MYAALSERNHLLTTLTNRITSISLHKGDPGTSTAGANEVTGGSYARKTPAWAAPAAGAVSAAELTFDVPGGESYSYIGFRNSAGDLIGSQALATAQTLSSAGQLKVTPTLNVNALA